MGKRKAELFTCELLWTLSPGCWAKPPLRSAEFGKNMQVELELSYFSPPNTVRDDSGCVVKETPLRVPFVTPSNPPLRRRQAGSVVPLQRPDNRTLLCSPGSKQGSTPPPSLFSCSTSIHRKSHRASGRQRLARESPPLAGGSHSARSGAEGVGPLAGGRCQSREGVWWGWALGLPRVEAAHCV